MEYNTSRKKLVLPEYGRNIQRMVEYIVSVEDKEKRNQLAHAIISIMGNMNPHLRDVSDFKHKLWDHLAIISDFKLDIDSPYETPSPETFQQKPEKVDYNNKVSRYKHYGKVIEKLIAEAIALEEGEKKEALKYLVATHMKRSYITWNKDSVSDEVIFKDLMELSNGEIVLHSETTTLPAIKDFISKPRPQQHQNGKKKKPMNKKRNTNYKR